MEMTAPDGEIATRALHGPSGSRQWLTWTSIVTESPGCSVPDDWLSQSQEAPVDADQSTAELPDAVSVMSVVSPLGCASTVSRPGPLPARVVGEITSTETSGE